MKTRRLGAALVVLTALALAAGCTGGDGAAPAGSPAGAAPGRATGPAADELTAAARKTASDSYRYTVDLGPGARGEGAADPAARAASVKMVVEAEDAAISTETLAVGADHYLRFTGLDLPGLGGGKWMHLDAGKVSGGRMLGVRNAADPTGTIALTGTATSVQKTGDRGYKGSLDLTRGDVSAVVDAATLGRLAGRAKSVPFEATVDEQGRLVSFGYTLPAVGEEKAAPMTVRYSGFGAKVTLQKPAPAEVVEAPESVYALLQR
jgi:hypothetical protein